MDERLREIDDEMSTGNISHGEAFARVLNVVRREFGDRAVCSGREAEDFGDWLDALYESTTQRPA